MTLPVWKTDCGHGCSQVVGVGQRRDRFCEHNRPYAKVRPEQKPKPQRADRPRSTASPKPPVTPRWLTEGFALGVDQREAAEAVRTGEPYGCWFAQFDPEERPCTDVLERCHIINRQRVEKALGEMLRGATVEDADGFPVELAQAERFVIVELAAWDPRNARLGCTGHHPRFDSNATPRLFVPYESLPDHVLEFAEDWKLEHELERKCPKAGSPVKEGAR